MDTTMNSALMIISNPNITKPRKDYWINRVKDEIAAFFCAGLMTSARELENELNAVISSSKVQ